MKVLKEFSKEQKDLSLPRRPMRNPVANALTVSQSNGAMESKSLTTRQDMEEKVSSGSRQQSMRFLISAPFRDYLCLNDTCALTLSI